MNINETTVTNGLERMTVNATGCEFDSHSRKINILYFRFLALVTRQSVTLSIITHHAMPPEICERWVDGSVLTLGFEISSTSPKMGNFYNKPYLLNKYIQNIIIK